MMDSIKYLGWFESEKDVPNESGLCFLPGTLYPRGKDYFLYKCYVAAWDGSKYFEKMGRKHEHGVVYCGRDDENDKYFCATACYGRQDKWSSIHSKSFEDREDAIDHVLTNFYTFYYQSCFTLRLSEDDTEDEDRDHVIRVSSYKGSRYFSFLKGCDSKYGYHYHRGFFGVIKPNGKLYLKKEGGEVKISGLKNAPTDPKELTEFLKTFFRMEEC